MTDVRAWRKCLRELKWLMDSLPSKEEVAELVSAVGCIINILNDLNESLQHLPTSEEAKKAQEAVERLEIILERNPLIRGGKISKARSEDRDTQVSSLPRIPSEHVVQEIKVLEKLPEDTLRERLSHSKQYSKDFLVAILAALGRKAPSKANRKQIVEQIVTAITTRRTYEGLRGGS